MLRTLAGQLAPMGGTVLLEGRSLAGYTGTQRAQKLALMAPHSRRMELTTCFDFVSAGRYPTPDGWAFCLPRTGSRCTEPWSWWARRSWQTGILTASVTASASASCWPGPCASSPEVILLDEPTSFLDIKGKIELLTILGTLGTHPKAGGDFEPARAGTGRKNSGYGGVRFARAVFPAC